MYHTLKILRNDVILLRCVPSFVIINFKFRKLAIRFLNPLGLTSLNLRIFLPSGNEQRPYAFQCWKRKIQVTWKFVYAFGSLIFNAFGKCFLDSLQLHTVNITIRSNGLPTRQQFVMKDRKKTAKLSEQTHFSRSIWFANLFAKLERPLGRRMISFCGNFIRWK